MQRSKKMATEMSGSTSTINQNRGGLEGVVAATTAISKVDGAAGRLIYRGYDIHSLARTTSYEEIAYLLWFGHLPNRRELDDLCAKLVAARSIPDIVMETLRGLPAKTDPLDALRTAVSDWGALSISGLPTIEQIGRA